MGGAGYWPSAFLRGHGQWRLDILLVCFKGSISGGIAAKHQGGVGTESPAAARASQVRVLPDRFLCFITVMPDAARLCVLARS
jgi:hypothetical protein